MPCNDPAAKCAVEKRRRETIVEKLAEIKKILFPATAQQQDVPFHRILAKAAETLTGTYPIATTPPSSSGSSSSAGSSRSSTPVGPVKKDRNEYKRELEAIRRNKEAVAYNSLYNYVIANRLAPSVKIGKIELLNIVIQELQNPGNRAPAAAAAPTTPSSSLQMQHLLAAPVAPVVVPPLPAALPVAPGIQEYINFAQYLAYIQLFPQFFTVAPMLQNASVDEEVEHAEDENEIIDVVNV